MYRIVVLLWMLTLPFTLLPQGQGAFAVQNENGRHAVCYRALAFDAVFGKATYWDCTDGFNHKIVTTYELYKDLRVKMRFPKDKEDTK